jgi:hypothetical protein
MALKLYTRPLLDIPTAGARVQLQSGDEWVTTIVFYAPAANTGLIWIGDSSVAANRGVALAPGATFSLSQDSNGGDGDEFNLADIYVDTATNGNDVAVSVVRQR